MHILYCVFGPDTNKLAPAYSFNYFKLLITLHIPCRTTDWRQMISL